MRRLPIALLTMCLVGFNLCAASASGQAAPAAGAVGIAPAYDGGGEEWGPLFVQQLTLSLFDEVQARTAVPAVLLNPGGVYTPLDSSWLVDYASDRPELKYLLVTTLKPVIAPEHGKWTIVVDASLLERAGGKELSNWTVTTEIKGRNTDIFASYVESNSFKAAFTTGRRTFDKSPLGHAAKTLAESIADELKSRLELGTAVAPAAGGSGSGRSCPMKVRITYTYKHAASQSYSLLVNGLEESIAAEGGYLPSLRRRLRCWCSSVLATLRTSWRSSRSTSYRRCTPAAMGRSSWTWERAATRTNGGSRALPSDLSAAGTKCGESSPTPQKDGLLGVG